jgi:hypothetical protein
VGTATLSFEEVRDERNALDGLAQSHFIRYAAVQVLFVKSAQPEPYELQICRWLLRERRSPVESNQLKRLKRVSISAHAAKVYKTK